MHAPLACTLGTHGPPHASSPCALPPYACTLPLPCMCTLPCMHPPTPMHVRPPYACTLPLPCMCTLPCMHPPYACTHQSRACLSCADIRPFPPADFILWLNSTLGGFGCGAYHATRTSSTPLPALQVEGTPCPTPLSDCPPPPPAGGGEPLPRGPGCGEVRGGDSGAPGGPEGSGRASLHRAQKEGKRGG